MSEDIPFNKTLDLAPDTVDEPVPGVRRVMANNPGPFTFKGTLSYIVGHGNVAIVDPGPDDPAHIGALLDAVRGETVTHIFVTHTHRDHSPAVPAVKAATGATVYAEGPHRAARPLHIGEHNPLDSSGDRDFRPDVQLKDGEVVEGDGWAIEGVTTPGHTANHMSFALKGRNILFAGDHVMGWSTTVVSPPDGDMAAYMASLTLLHDRDDRVYYPAHGPAVHNPRQLVRGMIGHRRQRERQILKLLGQRPQTIAELVPQMYKGLDQRLWPAAGQSVKAHLLDLERRGAVTRSGETWTILT